MTFKILGLILLAIYMGLTLVYDYLQNKEIASLKKRVRKLERGEKDRIDRKDC